ncbi:MAG: xanthine dehydrogenase family protein subunit M [Bradyrhizobiaceae bacterium]|nr:xanthine dehydrogenase family protein subunit M [Bradyrhizobiaceae bacterium]
MYDFNFHRPKDLASALGFLQADEAKLIAGGQTLIPTLKQRLAAPKHLVDLSLIEALTGIERKGRNIVIGAMTRHAEVAASGVVRKAIPALSDLADGIGDPAVRNRGTIGGSVANNDPSADYPAACLALAATIITNKREIPADDFFKGLFETALEPDEIITQISFPVPLKAAYMKFPNPASRYALVGVFVAKDGKGVRVAVTGAGESGVFRVPAMERALDKKFAPKSIENVKIDPNGLIADLHGSAEYRAHLIGVMARRAVDAAAKTPK